MDGTTEINGEIKEGYLWKKKKRKPPSRKRQHPHPPQKKRLKKRAKRKTERLKDRKIASGATNRLNGKAGITEMGSSFAVRDAGNFSRKRQREAVLFSMIQSPLGWLGVVETPKGVSALLREKRGRSALRRKILLRYPIAIEKRGIFFKKTEPFLRSYFKGRRTLPFVPLDLSSQTPFQKKVLSRVGQIPRGRVRTYRWLAQRVRCPGGYRACGQALHRNPAPLLIPCHRVVMTSKEMGGFVWGKEIKRRLLQIEAPRRKAHGRTP